MKKALKIVGILAGLFILIIIGIVTYIYVAYPAARVKSELIRYAEQEYGLIAEIDLLSFNIFSGFNVDGFRFLGTSSQAETLSAPLVSVQSATLHYELDLSALAFGRLLQIDKLSFAGIDLQLSIDDSGGSSFDAAIEQVLARLDSVPSNESPSGLPLAIDIRQINFSNIRLGLQLESPAGRAVINLAPLALHVSGIVIDKQGNLSARLEIPGDPIDYSAKMIDPSHVLLADIAGEILLQATVTTRHDSALFEGDLQLPPAKLGLTGLEQPLQTPQIICRISLGQLDQSTRRLEIPRIDLSLGSIGQMEAALSAEFNQQNGLIADLQGRSASVRLSELIDYLMTQQPALMEAVQGLEIAGNLRSSGAWLRVNRDSISFDIELEGEGIALEDKQSGLALRDGGLDLGVKGSVGSAVQNAPTVELRGRQEVIRFPVKGGRILQSGPMSYEVGFTTNEQMLPAEIRLDSRIDNVSGGFITASARAVTRYRSVSSPAIQEISLTAHAEAASIGLAALSDELVDGVIAAEFDLRGGLVEGMAISGSLQNDTLLYFLEDAQGTFPAMIHHISLTARMDEQFNTLEINEGSLENDASTTLFTAQYKIPTSSARIDINPLELNMADIPSWLPAAMFSEAQLPVLNGVLWGEGFLKMRPVTADSVAVTGSFRARSAAFGYHDVAMGIYADLGQFDSRWLTTAGAAIGEYTMLFGAPRFPDYLPLAIPPVKLQGHMSVGTGVFSIDEGIVQIPRWQVSGNYTVRGSLEQDGVVSKTSTELHFKSDSLVNIGQGIRISGEAHAAAVIDLFTPEDSETPQPAKIRGQVSIPGLTIMHDSLASVHGLSSEISFEQEMELTAAVLVAPPDTTQDVFALARQDFLINDILMPVLRQPEARTSSWLKIDSIAVSGFHVTDLSADLEVGKSRIDVPQYRLRLFGGNMVGNMWIGLGNGDPAGIEYRSSAQISSIEAAQFRRLGSRVGQGSRFSADFFLTGRGADPKAIEEITSNLEGRFNVTQMEKRVAANLLDALDPSGTDAGVQRMRLLLKTKYNVKQFTFEIKNGFVSTSLVPVRPWFAPFRLPSRISFTRGPVNLFLRNSLGERFGG